MGMQKRGRKTITDMRDSGTTFRLAGVPIDDYILIDSSFVRQILIYSKEISQPTLDLPLLDHLLVLFSSSCSLLF